jgi:hypothetical protein
MFKYIYVHNIINVQNINILENYLVNQNMFDI